MKLLREYVKVLAERIRSNSFDAREFKQLAANLQDSTKPLVYYADEHLQRLGQGTARTVYLLSAKKVLKIAQNTAQGVAQNNAEIRGFQNPNVKPFVAAIYDHDPNGLFIVSELVRELDTEEEFQRMTGFPWDFFVDCVRDGALPESWDPADDQLEFWQGVQKMIGAGLIWGDITVLNHWGKTTDGRLVLLDYGFTR